jgi:hypothetical protein
MRLSGLFAPRNQKRVRGKPSARRPVFRPSVESLEQRWLPSTTDMVVQWNAIAIEATKRDHALGAPGDQFGPTRASRALAIVQAAVYDSVNSIDPENTLYLIQVAAPKDASVDAAVAQAAHDTLVSLYPDQQPYFDSELASSLQGIPTGPAVEGVAVGAAVAKYTIAARTNDGSQVDAPGQPVNYVYGQLPGQWRPDPLHADAQPLTPDWGGVKPFAVQSATQFLPPPPPPLDSKAYTAAYLEVKAIGAQDSIIRTSEQTNIGFFWGYDAQPGLCAPVRFYNQIAEVLAQQEGNSEVDNARFFALINIAMADSAITCWDAKYQYDLWRPITAIRENDPGTGPTGLGSGNPFLQGQGDPTWSPVGAPAHNGGTNFTPPFPSYTSGHASIGGALFKMMEDFYGKDHVHFTISTDESNTITNTPLGPRSYDSFSQAAGENALSRIYLGIHYEFDATNGIKTGDDTADYIFEHTLLPLQGPTPHALPSLNPESQIQLAIHHEDAQSRAATRSLEHQIRVQLDGSQPSGHQDGAAAAALAAAPKIDNAPDRIPVHFGSSLTSPDATPRPSEPLNLATGGPSPPGATAPREGDPPRLAPVPAAAPTIDNAFGGLPVSFGSTPASPDTAPPPIEPLNLATGASSPPSSTGDVYGDPGTSDAGQPAAVDDLQFQKPSRFAKQAVR